MFSAASFSPISYGEVPSGQGQPLPLCIRQPYYSLWLSSNFAALKGYCRRHHSYDSTLLTKLNLFFSLAGAAVCVTFTDDGWNVFRPLAAVVMVRGHRGTTRARHVSLMYHKW
jgi:hypothetical protein